MKHKLQKIKEESQELCTEISTDLRTALRRLNQIGDEYHRLTQLSGQAARVVDQIDLEFKTKTKLSKQDAIILFLTTAIQCTRQYLLTNDMLRITDKEGDNLKKSILNAKVGGWQPVPPDAAAVLTQSVPYDAVNFYSPDIKEQLGNTGLSGTTHRYHTLGHDPLLLPTAVARQAIHFGSDYFTKQGLPVPLVATVNNDLAKNMITRGSIDLWNVSRGAVLAYLINQLVAAIHQLFYQEKRDGSQTLYEVRTRKILSYSNFLASKSNVIVAAITQDARKLDVGGMLVTLTRIVSDYRFIHEIKKDFLKNEIYDRIVGTEYDFMKGAV